MVAYHLALVHSDICLVVVHVIVVSSYQSQFPSPIRMS